MMRSTIYTAFRETAARYPRKPALRYKGDDGEYRSISFEALGDSVDRVAASLSRLGIAKGDRVAIFAYHGPEWVMADLAALKLGAVIVPLYHTLSPSAARHILNDSGCKLIFVEGKELFAVIDAVRGEIPSLAHVVAFDEKGIEENDTFLKFDDLMARDARAERDAGGETSPVSPGDPATIVYTSGTTGAPKGVVLSHGNILFDAFSTLRRFHVGPDDIFLSFLPLCHMLERTCGHYTMLFAGATIAYAEGISTIVSDVRKIRPTIIIVVPRIVEKIYEAVHSISRNPASVGVCYHLTAGLNNATPLEEISELASRHFGRERFTIVSPEEFAAYISKMKDRFGEKELGMVNEIMLYMPYLTGELRFDNSNAVRETRLEAPPVRTYFGKMAEYIRATN